MEEGVLPLPVRIPLYPQAHFAAWGWLTINLGEGTFAIDIVSGCTTKSYVDVREIVRQMAACFPNNDALMDMRNIEMSVQNISVRLSETRYERLTPETLLSIIQLGSVLEVPRSFANSLCMATAPRSVDTATVSGKRASKRPRKAASKQRPPSPPRSPMRTDGGGSYDITKIGGDPYVMNRIAHDCPAWDDEVVRYVIDHGGRPPLIDVCGRTNVDLFCTFRAPNGDTVRNVRVPKCIVAVLYGRE